VGGAIAITEDGSMQLEVSECAVGNTTWLGTLKEHLTNIYLSPCPAAILETRTFDPRE
jgi:hypothetical protein